MSGEGKWSIKHPNAINFSFHGLLQDLAVHVLQKISILSLELGVWLL